MECIALHSQRAQHHSTRNCLFVQRQFEPSAVVQLLNSKMYQHTSKSPLLVLLTVTPLVSIRSTFNLCLGYGITFLYIIVEIPIRILSPILMHM